jgi:hypothetical protein
VLKEQVNVGIFYIFPHENRCELLFPKNLHRLEALFPQTNIANIKNRLTAFGKRAKTITLGTNFHDLDAQSLIIKHFGPREASNLYFETPKKAFFAHFSDLIENDRKEYFDPFYTSSSPKKEAHDGAFLRSLFDKQVSKLQIKKELLQTNYVIKGKRSDVEIDYAWQNGQLNLVQAVSFDFKARKHFEEKSFFWIGKLNYIADTLQENKIHLDFLVAKPRNTDLLPYFEESIANIKDIGKDFLGIVDESEIRSFTEKIAKNIH